MDLADVPRHRPMAFDKMEALIKEMQDPETGVPVRSQKIFLSIIPSAFMGYDLVEWLMDRFNLDEASNVEAINLGNLLCQHGYFFPVNDLKNLVLKDDSSLYRFQSPYYWPWTGSRAGAALGPDNVEYAIYLVKRTLRNKQRHALDDYEAEALTNLKRNLAAKWEFITMQAEEQVRLAKDRKKGDKIVSDSQERAYWRVVKPPPGVPSALEPCPVPVRVRNNRPKKRTAVQIQREIDHLKASLDRTRVKSSVALEALVTYSETFAAYDPWLTPPQPSNPWISDDTLYWQINSPIVEIPSEKRVQRWALSIEELVNDPTGLQEFTSFLRKEYSHENIRFWLAVMDLRKSSTKAIPGKLQQIYEEFLKPGAPCEINIDGATADKVAEGIKTGSRYALDHAAEHVYNLLLKKDCYPRFVRSDHFQRLLAEGKNVHQKKAKFFNFGGGQVKKKPGCSSAGASSTLTRRRGSDRSLSGSAHELGVLAAQPPRPPDPSSHSHSQSNLLELRDGAEESSDDVLPWEACGREAVGPRRRQDSAADSGSSSSDISAVGERRRLPQQSTLDGGLRGAPPPLRRLSAVEPRHLPPAASPPRSPRPMRVSNPLPTQTHHPTPTISVSSAPDETSPDRDDPPSVFGSTAHTPVDPEEKTLSCDSECVSEPSRSPESRTLTRETTIKDTPASSKDSRLGDLPESSVTNEQKTINLEEDRLATESVKISARESTEMSIDTSSTSPKAIATPVGTVEQVPSYVEDASSNMTPVKPLMASFTPEVATSALHIAPSMSNVVLEIASVAPDVTIAKTPTSNVESVSLTENIVVATPKMVSAIPNTALAISDKTPVALSPTGSAQSSKDVVELKKGLQEGLAAEILKITESCEIPEPKPKIKDVETSKPPAESTVEIPSKSSEKPNDQVSKPETSTALVLVPKSLDPYAVAPLAETEDLIDDDRPLPKPTASQEATEVTSDLKEAQTSNETSVDAKPAIAQKAKETSLDVKPASAQKVNEACLDVNPASRTEEQNRNDICPWEDENSCESDAPFVKTYATLGYL